MKNRALDIENYLYQPNDFLLLDTNIWRYCLTRPPSDKFNRIYSRAIANIIKHHAVLVSDVLILSEFVNSYSQEEYKAAFKSKHKNMKEFRKSSDFVSVTNKLKPWIESIFRLCRLYDHPFANEGVKQALNDFYVGICDLNDSLLINTCRYHGWKFVTHDADCSEGGITVLTANAKLLQACP